MIKASNFAPLLLLAGVPMVIAAPITRQVARNTNGIGDLEAGTEVFACNGGSASIIVGGATFTPVDLGSGYVNKVCTVTDTPLDSIATR